MVNTAHGEGRIMRTMEFCADIGEDGETSMIILDGPIDAPKLKTKVITFPGTFIRCPLCNKLLHAKKGTVKTLPTHGVYVTY